MIQNKLLHVVNFIQFNDSFFIWLYCNALYMFICNNFGMIVT